MGYIKLLILFIKHFIKQEKAVFFFILSGIIISSTVFFVFTGFYFSDKEDAEWTAYKKNQVCFSFDGHPDIAQITDRILHEKYIKNIIYRTYPSQDANIVIASYHQGYPIDSSRVLAGRPVQNDELTTINCSETFCHDYWKISGSALRVGSVIMLNNAEYTCSGIVLANDFDILLPFDALQKIHPEKVEITYIFHAGTSLLEMEELNNDILQLFNPLSVARPDETYQYSLIQFLLNIKDIFYLLIIAILNHMFFYSFLLKKRLYSYSILAVYGMPTNRFAFFIFFELFIVFIIGFHASLLLYATATKIIDSDIIYHSFFYQYLYSFLILLTSNAVMFFILIKKVFRMNPVALYRESMVE